MFDVSVSPPILFGAGAVDQVGARVKALGGARVILVTDKGVREAGIAGQVAESLEAAGIRVVLYDEVPSDPPDHLIDACATFARNERVDGVVAVGGGSVLDTAKGVNVLLANPLPISRYYGLNVPQEASGPLALIPTTSGTGSEVTPIAVVSDTENNRKVGVIGKNCLASLAIVDPALTLKLPRLLTAATGMDAFSHAAEALTSGLANPVSDALAERAISLIVRSLKTAVRDGSDLSARTNMSLAAMLAGLAFKDGLPHLGHAIAHTLGARFHVHHGVACALALPEVMEYAADAVPEKVRVVGQTMGLALTDGLSAREIGKRVAVAVRELNAAIGIPSLKDLGIEESALEGVAAAVLKDDCASFVPMAIDEELVAATLGNVYRRS